MRSAHKVIILALFVPLFVAACSPGPRGPDLSTREAFAKTVMTAAVSGSVEQVERLVPQDRIDVSDGAQQLVDEARGWNPATWRVGIRDDVPEFATVHVAQEGKPSTIRYDISWTDDHWGLVLGTSKSRPTTGFATPGPIDTSTPKDLGPSK
jgi:hypothetical protein